MSAQKITRCSEDEKQREAFKRMGVLRMSPKNAFPPDLNDEDRKQIEDFERSHGVLVYALIRNEYEPFGVVDSYLYVSDYKDEWDADIEDLEEGRTRAFIYNHKEPRLSKFEIIGIASISFYGLVRMW